MRPPPLSRTANSSGAVPSTPCANFADANFWIEIAWSPAEVGQDETAIREAAGRLPSAPTR